MTDPWAALDAAVSAAKAAADAVQSQLAAANTQVAALQADQASLVSQLAAANATIAQLQGKLNPTTVWGIDATTAAEHATREQMWGLPIQPWCWRYYLAPGASLHLPTEYSLAAGETVVISSKILPQNLTFPELVGFFQTFPTDRDVYYCVWHEPEDDIAKGSFTAAQLKGAWHTARLAQQQVKNPHVKLAPILMDWSWQPASGRNVEDYLPADADFDVLCTDIYFAGTIGRPVSGIPTAFDGVMATAKAHGKPWGITELGVGQKVTGQARLDALTLLAQTIKAKGATVALWFDQGSAANQWWLDAAGIAAFKAGW